MQSRRRAPASATRHLKNVTLLSAANTNFNEGEFTVTRVDGDDRVVIPEDGIYAIQYSYYFDVDNDSSRWLVTGLFLLAA